MLVVEMENKDDRQKSGVKDSNDQGRIQLNNKGSENENGFKNDFNSKGSTKLSQKLDFQTKSHENDTNDTRFSSNANKLVHSNQSPMVHKKTEEIDNNSNTVPDFIRYKPGFREELSSAKSKKYSEDPPNNPPKKESKYVIDEGLFKLDEKAIRSNQPSETKKSHCSPLKVITDNTKKDNSTSYNQPIFHSISSPVSKSNKEGQFKGVPRAETFGPIDSVNSNKQQLEKSVSRQDSSSNILHFNKKKEGSSVKQKENNPYYEDSRGKKKKENSRFPEIESIPSIDYGGSKTPNAISNHRMNSIQNFEPQKHRKVEEKDETIYSKLYLDSLQELHKTEIESLLTRHHYEKEQMRREYESIMKNKIEEYSQNNEHINTVKHLKHSLIEFEQIVSNLKTQNSLLKEENNFFRKSEYEREKEFDEYKRDIESRVTHMKNTLYAEILK